METSSCYFLNHYLSLRFCEQEQTPTDLAKQTFTAENNWERLLHRYTAL